MKITITKDDFNNYMSKPFTAFSTLVGYSSVFVEDKAASCPENFKNFFPDFKKRGFEFFGSIADILSKAFGTSIKEATDIFLSLDFSDKVLESFEISQEDAEQFKQVLEALKECVGDFCSAFDIDIDDVDTLILSNDNGTFVELLSKYRVKYNSSATIGILPSIKSLFYSIASAEDYINKLSEKTEEDESSKPNSSAEQVEDKKEPTEKSKKLSYDGSTFSKMINDLWTRFNNYEKDFLELYQRDYNLSFPDMPELDDMDALKIYKDITLVAKAKENLLSKVSKLLSLSKNEVLNILNNVKPLTQNRVSFILNKDEGLSAEEVEESIIKPLYICYKMGYQPRFLEDLSLLYGNAEVTFECCYSDNESCSNYLKDYLTVSIEKDSVKVRDEFDSLLLALKYANQDTQEKREDSEDKDKLALYQEIIENINIATEFINNHLSSAKSLEYSTSEGIPASELMNKFIVPVSKAKDLLIDNVYCSSFELKLKLIRAVNSSFSLLEKVFGVEDLTSELNGYLKTN